MSRKKEILYSVPEAAKELGVSAWTVYRWLNAKKLGGYRLAGHKWRISEEHINEFIKKNEQTIEVNNA